MGKFSLQYWLVLETRSFYTSTIFFLACSDFYFFFQLYIMQVFLNDTIAECFSQSFSWAEDYCNSTKLHLCIYNHQLFIYLFIIISLLVIIWCSTFPVVYLFVNSTSTSNSDNWRWFSIMFSLFCLYLYSFDNIISLSIPLFHGKCLNLLDLLCHCSDLYYGLWDM